MRMKKKRNFKTHIQKKQRNFGEDKENYRHSLLTAEKHGKRKMGTTVMEPTKTTAELRDLLFWELETEIGFAVYFVISQGYFCQILH